MTQILNIQRTSMYTNYSDNTHFIEHVSIAFAVASSARSYIGQFLSTRENQQKTIRSDSENAIPFFLRDCQLVENTVRSIRANGLRASDSR